MVLFLWVENNSCIGTLENKKGKYVSQRNQLLIYKFVSAVFGHCLQLKVLQRNYHYTSKRKKDSSIVKETFFPWKYSFELNLAVQLPLKVTVLMRPLRIERRNMLIGNTGAEHFIIGILLLNLLDKLIRIMRPFRIERISMLIELTCWFEKLPEVTVICKMSKDWPS